MCGSNCKTSSNPEPTQFPKSSKEYFQKSTIITCRCWLLPGFKKLWGNSSPSKLGFRKRQRLGQERNKTLEFHSANHIGGVQGHMGVRNPSFDWLRAAGGGCTSRIYQPIIQHIRHDQIPPNGGFPTALPNSVKFSGPKQLNLEAI